MKRLPWASCVAILLVILLATAITGCSADHQEQPTPVRDDTKIAANPPATDVAPTTKAGPLEKSGHKQAPAPLTMVIPAAEAGTPDKNDQKQKKAYLTFDDGPNTHFTVRILDILDRYKVKATFMVVGRNVELNPGLITQIIDRGHGVVNHTYSHDYKIIYSSPEALIADLKRNEEILKPLGESAAKVFRAPGGPGKLTKTFQSKLAAEGYISVGWNISGMDSDPAGITSGQVYNNVAAGLARVEKLQLTPIVLLHDGTQLYTTDAGPDTPLARYIQNRESVITALPGIIELFLAKGYTFTLVDENTPPAW